jgi:hypothetical protein
MAWDDAPAVPAYSWATGEDADLWSPGGLPGYGTAGPTGRNAVRGFPPGPDDPLPVYSGPFTAWNRTAEDSAPPRRLELNGAARDADPARQVGAATITPDDFDTDFSLPAIRDPDRPRQKDPARRKDPGAGRTAAPPRAVGPAARSRTATGPAPDGPDHRRPPGQSGRGAPGQAGRAGRAGGSRQRGGRTARRSGRQPVTLAIVAAAVIVVAGATILLTSSPSHRSAGQTPGRTHPPAGQSTSPAPPGVWKYIGQRSTDPLPLTIAELYPRTFTSGITSFLRSVDTKSKSCRGALIGSPLQTAIHKAGCTQAVRASYWSHGAGLMATIGVFNLKTAAGAIVAAKSAGPSDFVALLPAKIGPTHRLGQGTGIEETVVEGHYLVLVYAESIKLTAPKTSLQRQRLRSFMKLLVIQVTVPLEARKATGKPTAG